MQRRVGSAAGTVSKQLDMFGAATKPVAAPISTGSGRYTYCCAKRNCKLYDVEVKHDVTPYQAAELPMRFVRCSACGNSMLWLGPLEGA